MTSINPSDVGVYIITTTAKIPQIDPGTGVNRIISYSFTMTVSECDNQTLTLISPVPDNIAYTIEGSPIKIGFPQYTRQPSQCTDELVYKLELVN